MKLALEISVAGAAPRRFESRAATVRIGRDPQCELAFVGPEQDNVSWRHAEIELTSGGAWLQDVGSSNGTFLNGFPVKDRVALNVGDRVQLGRTGPTLKAVQVDVAPAKAQAGAAPKAAPRREPEPSATRMLLIDMKGKQQRTNWLAAALALILLLVIAGVLWEFWLKHRKTEGLVAGATKSAAEALGKTAEIARELSAIKDVNNKVKDGLDELKKSQEANTARIQNFEDKVGLVEKKADDIKDLVAQQAGKLLDLNAMLAKANNAPKPADAPPPVDPPKNIGRAGPQVERRARLAPKLKQDTPVLIYHTNKQNMYAGRLKYVNENGIGVELPKVPHNYPSEVYVREFPYSMIRVLGAEQGMFVYDPETKKFESVFIHYLFDKEKRKFCRWDPPDSQMPNLFESKDAFLVTNGVTGGQTFIGPGLEFGLSLPMRHGPEEIDPGNLSMVRTRDGIHEYDPSEGKYVFTELQVLRQRYMEAKKKEMLEREEVLWKRRLELMDRNLEAFRIAAGYYNRWWWPYGAWTPGYVYWWFR